MAIKTNLKIVQSRLAVKWLTPETTSTRLNPDTLTINPLNPHDALKLHFTSLKTDLIFLQPRVLE